MLTPEAVFSREAVPPEVTLMMRSLSVSAMKMLPDPPFSYEHLVCFGVGSNPSFTGGSLVENNRFEFDRWKLFLVAIRKVVNRQVTRRRPLLHYDFVCSKDRGLPSVVRPYQNHDIVKLNLNGLIANTMGGLTQTGADLAIPTNSSKLLPGYYLFIGFCLASLFLAKRLAHGIDTSDTEPRE